jgi:hypothetical protein
LIEVKGRNNENKTIYVGREVSEEGRMAGKRKNTLT